VNVRASIDRVNVRASIDRAIESVYPAKVVPATPWAARWAGDDYGLTADPSWRAVPWGRHVRSTEVGGRRVSYVDLGGGDRPPVVFVHGLGGNWQNWLENLPLIAQERRAIAVDLPGFGGSEMPHEDVSISNYGRFVEAFCDGLDLGPVVIVGNSMGGFIGAEVAIAFPARVERLVLAAAAGISVTNLRRRPTMTLAQVTTALGVGRLAARHRHALVARRNLRHLALSSVVRHPTRIAPDLACELLAGAGAPGYVPALDALLTYDFRDRLPEIGCPTLLIWGGEDMVVPVRDADEYERLIPDSRKVILQDTGHTPMVERPTTFNARLSEFMSEMGEAGSRRSAVA
jgi:pimeloyl-ACP methyl ester carboxylesterase